MASLVKKGKVWYAVFYTGKGKDRKQKWQVLSPNKSVAQIKFGDLIEDRNAQKYDHPQKQISWTSFCEKYLAYAKVNKKPQTYDRDVITLMILGRMFSLASTEGLTPNLLEEYKIRRKMDGIKEATINRDLGLFKAMGKKAFEWGYLRNNPLTVVKKLKMARNRPKYFTKQEIQVIFENTADQFERVMVQLGIYTGMRREEICRLQWEDLDWNNKLVRIVGRDGWTPKDFEARDIPLHPALEKELKDWRPQTFSDSSLYVLSLHDRKASGPYIGKLFKRILKRSGVKGNFHTMRHTYASHLVNAGVELYTVSKLLGHASIKTTEIYAHIQSSSLHNAVLKLSFEDQQNNNGGTQ